MNKENKELDGKLALVTGGTKGIGKAIADTLALAGATVIISARKPSEEENTHQFIAADLTSNDAIDQLTEALIQGYGIPDILINNVGGTSSPAGGFHTLSDEDWKKDINLNLLASIRLDKAIVPKMMERGSGSIIHISSVNGKLPLHQSNFSYGVMKAALNAYSKTLANQVAKNGI